MPDLSFSASGPSRAYTPAMRQADGTLSAATDTPIVEVKSVPLAPGAASAAKQDAAATILSDILAALAPLATDLDMAAGFAAVVAKNEQVRAGLAALATNADLLAGFASVVAKDEQIRALLAGTLAAARPPLAYTMVPGFPKALTNAWQKVATTSAATKALRIAPVVGAAAYDIEWVAVPAGAPAPTDPVGEPILGGDDFAAGVPIGDLYLRSATAQTAIVKTGA